jgi:hypothetical protein
MKILSVLISILLLFAITGFAAEQAAKGETYMIIKYFDHAKEAENRLVTSSEMKALQDEIAKEAKLWSAAMSAAEKAWKADSSTSKKPFPRTAISPKKITILEQFTNQDKATAKLEAMDKAAADAAEAEKEREKKKKDNPYNRRLSQMLGDRAIKSAKDDGKGEREALLDSARSLFEDKLNELGGGGAAEEKPAESKEEKKKK